MADSTLRPRRLGEGEIMTDRLKPKDGIIKIYKVEGETFNDLLNYYPKYKKQI